MIEILTQFFWHEFRPAGSSLAVETFHLPARYLYGAKATATTSTVGTATAATATGTGATAPTTTAVAATSFPKCSLRCGGHFHGFTGKLG